MTHEIAIIATWCGIIGFILTILATIHSYTKYRIDYPDLPIIRYGLFRGYKTKRNVVKIAIVRNGSADYAKHIQSGFQNRAVKTFSKTEYAVKINDHEGFPYSDEDDKNKNLIDEILKSNPNILVTIGTQVSVSAVQHFGNKIPIIAIGLGAPLKCNLVDPLDQCSLESGNYACVRYGTSMENRVDFLSKLFDNSKRKLKFFFIWNDSAPQDRFLADEVREIASRRNDISLDVMEIKDEALPSALDEIGNIIFGFYHLNRNLDKFLMSSKKAVFLGLNPNDTHAGTIASTGSNDYQLGELAVDKILIPRIIKRTPLCKIPLVEPKPYYTINKRIAELSNLAFSKYAKKISSEIIDHP